MPASSSFDLPKLQEIFDELRRGRHLCAESQIFPLLVLVMSNRSMPER